MSLPVIKDLLGLLGGILLIVPFLRDFLQRRELRFWTDLRRRFPGFRRAIDPIAAAQYDKLTEPSQTDMRFVLFGILFLIASFAAGLYDSASGTR